MTNLKRNTRGRKKASKRLGFSTVIKNNHASRGESVPTEEKRGKISTHSSLGGNQRTKGAVAKLSEKKQKQTKRKSFQLIKVCRLPASSPEAVELDWDAPELGLEKLGLFLKEMLPFKPFKHQARALRAILLEDKDLIVYVGTGSGKTEIYLFAGIELLLQKKIRNLILFFPTKALLKDQLARVATFLEQVNNYFFAEEPSKFFSYAEYSGAISREEIATIEKQRPEILLGTFDKFWYRLFRPPLSAKTGRGAAPEGEVSERFLEHLLSAGLLVFDEIHILSGLVASHIHEALKCHRKRNPKARFILCSATIGEVPRKKDNTTQEGAKTKATPILAFSRPSFSLNFIPGTKETTAMIFGPSRRGPLDVFLVTYEELLPLLEFFLKELLREEWEQELCLVFGNSIQLLQTIYDSLLQKLLAISKASVKELKKGKEAQKQLQRKTLREVPLGLIYAGMSEEKKNELQSQIFTRLKRFILCTCLYEVGMNFPNVLGVISINFPITGPTGLKQQFGRIRLPEGNPNRLSFGILVLDQNNPLEEFYYEHPEEVQRLLSSANDEPVYFNPYNYELIKATILLRVIYGCQTKEELFALSRKKLDSVAVSPREDDGDEAVLIALYQRAFLWLLCKGMLHISSDDSITIGDWNLLWSFIKQHSLRLIDEQFELRLLKQRTSPSEHPTKLIGTFNRQKVLREALPSNLLRHEGQAYLVRKTNFARKRIVLERIKSLPFVLSGKLPKNKLAVPELNFSHKFKKKEIHRLLLRYGPLTITERATAIAEYQPAGFVYRVLSQEENYIIITRSFGVALDFSQVNHLISSALSSENNNSEDEQKVKDLRKKFYRSFLQLLLIECERLLGIPTSNNSEVAVKINSERNLLIIYDRGSGASPRGSATGGNAHQIFLRIKELLQTILERLKNCLCVTGCSKCYSRYQLLWQARTHRLYVSKQQTKTKEKEGGEIGKIKNESHSRDREVATKLVMKKQLQMFLEELLR